MADEKFKRFQYIVEKSKVEQPIEEPPPRKQGVPPPTPPKTATPLPPPPTVLEKTLREQEQSEAADQLQEARKESVKPKQTTFRPSEFSHIVGKDIQDIEQQEEAVSQAEKGIFPFLFYRTATGQTVRGDVALAEYKQTREQLSLAKRKQWALLTGIPEWHPQTKIKKTEGGYVFEFPYASAGKYASYKKDIERAGFAGLLGTAFTGEDPLGIASAFYTATGQKQKAIDVKIKAMLSTQKPFHEFYFSMPTTQIGLAAAGGLVAGKAMPYAMGYLTAKIGATGVVAVKAAGVGIGAGLVGYGSYGIHQTYRSGKPGEALGQATTLGLSLIAAYGGYKATTPKQQTQLFQRGAERYIAKHTSFGTVKPGRMYFGQKGKPTSIMQIKGKSIKGLPTEIDKLSVTKISMWKPKGAKDFYIDFPGTGKPESFVRGITLGEAKVRGAELPSGRILPKSESYQYIYGKVSGAKKVFTFDRLTMHRLRAVTMKEAFGYGGVSQTVHKTIPIQAHVGISPTFQVRVTPFVPITTTILKPEILTVRRKKYDYDPVFKTITKTKPKVTPITEQILETLPTKRTIREIIPVMDVRTDKITSSLLAQDIIHKQVTQQKYITSTTTPTETIPTHPSYFGAFFLPRSVFGRGARHPGFNLYETKQQKREHIIPELHELFGIKIRR